VVVNLALIAAVARFRARRGREPARVRGGRRIQPRVAALLALGALEARGERVLLEEPQRRDVAAADPLQRVLAREPAALEERDGPDGAEPGFLQLGRERGGSREALEVDLADLREDADQPVPLEVARRKRSQGGASVRRQDACELRQDARAVDEVDDQPQDDAVEPPVPERERLGAAKLQPHSAPDGRARLREHLLGRVDSPHLRSALVERAREAAGAAADVEDAPSREVALREEEIDEFPPVLVDRPQPVVVLRERSEVRRFSARQ